MTDPDQTPPTPDPLDAAARSRLRARVLAGAAAQEPRRSWLLPAAAAAAVLVLAGVTGVLALGPGDDEAAPPGGPAGAPTSQPTPSTPAVTRTPKPYHPKIVPLPTGEFSVKVVMRHGVKVYVDTETGDIYGVGDDVSPILRVFDPDYDPYEGITCAGEVKRSLRKASPVSEFTTPTGTATFYLAGDRWTLCHDLGDSATVHPVGSLGDDTAAAGTAPYRVSSTVEEDGKRLDASFVAGGLVRDGTKNFAATYRFADGHVEKAVTQKDDAGRTWWLMAYTASRGVLTDPGTNQMTLDPIEVTVQTNDLRRTFDLAWATDTCAQTNHGC